MPLKKIVFKPGVNRENTRYTTEGGWYECDKIRFRQGTPEKIGGWQQFTASTFLGVCRSLWNWVTLAGLNVISVGTNLKYYIESGGTYYDITPLRYSTTTNVVNNPFTTVLASSTITVTDAASNVQTGDVVNISGVAAPVDGIPADQINGQHTVTRVSGTQYTFTVITGAASGMAGIGGSVTFQYFYYVRVLTNAYTTVNLSTTVTVHDVANGCITGDFVTLYPPVTFNGVTIDGEYQVNVVDADNYTIQASTPANASGSSTGTTYAQYQINTGPEIQVPRTGWGSGPWGLGGWGIGQSADVELRIWSESNWGEDLVFCPRYGGIYYWSASGGLNKRGVDIATLEGASDVPTVAQYIDVSDSSRFVFAFCCNDYGSTQLDPMLIRWSDQESVTNWTPDATNQAGSIRLSHGSEISSAWQVRQEIVVFTDSSGFTVAW